MENSNNKRMLSFLRRSEVQRRTGLSRSTIYLRIKKGTFPKPVKLGERSVGWVESEIDDWSQVRIQQRDAEANRGIER